MIAALIASGYCGTQEALAILPRSKRSCRDRIHGLDPAEKHFESPSRVAIRDYLKGSLGRFAGSKEVEVLLHFSAVAAPYVR